ncbi:MAG: SLC13 family permease [Gammaproteobacteria bacterium]|nr:SLC13 family permease [Gammaproteobacteria bacterium]
MGLDAWLALSLLAGCVALTARGRLAADFVFPAALVAAVLLRLLPIDEAIKGFANPGLIAVAALYVVAAGLRETGAIDALVQRLFGHPQTVRSAQARLLLPVAGLSAFVANTPIVAGLLPAVSSWARNHGISPSKLMMLLSYGAILGGTVTLLGTSTNLVMAGLLKDQGIVLNLFTQTPIALPAALAGIAFCLLAGRKLLPERLAASDSFRNPREYTVEMLVAADSPLAGQSIADAGLRHLSGLYLMEIVRDGRVLAAIGPEERLGIGDRLIFTGVVSAISELRRLRGLVPATDQIFKLNGRAQGRRLVEVVIGSQNPLCGKTIREGRFRNHYNAAVIALARDGARLNEKLGDVQLHEADTLLLETDENFLEQHRMSRDFLLINAIDGSEPPRHEKAGLAWAGVAAMVVLTSLNLVDVLTGTLLCALFMVGSGCCSMAGARASIDLQVLAVLGAALGLGAAVEKTGAARGLAEGLLSLGADQPWLLLILVYALTCVLTEALSNGAAAVIAFSVTTGLVERLGYNLLPFAMAILIAASASFLTPIGYQTNLMVQAAGGYRFGDYARLGAPLTLVVAAVALGLIPMVWPLLG